MVGSNNESQEEVSEGLDNKGHNSAVNVLTDYLAARAGRGPCLQGIASTHRELPSGLACSLL